MDLLLDTQAFLWVVTNPSRLSSAVHAELRDPSNNCMISVISPWELSIKHQLGKLGLARPIAELTAEVVRGLGASLLNVSLQHVLALRDMPLLHRDPFDRMLVAQAVSEGLTIITADRTIPTYNVATLW